MGVCAVHMPSAQGRQNQHQIPLNWGDSHAVMWVRGIEPVFSEERCTLTLASLCSFLLFEEEVSGHWLESQATSFSSLLDRFPGLQSGGGEWSITLVRS